MTGMFRTLQKVAMLPFSLPMLEVGFFMLMIWAVSLS